MKTNLTLFVLFLAGVLLLTTRAKTNPAPPPQTGHDCQSYSNVTESCGSTPCDPKNVTTVSWNGPGTQSLNPTFTTCKFGNGQNCEDQSVQVDQAIDDSFYCRCVAPNPPDPICCTPQTPQYCPPSPTPTPDSCPQTCSEPDPDLFDKDMCAYPNDGGCPPPSSPDGGNSSCCRWPPCCSPVVIDTLGNGFSLTNVHTGVRFDLDSDGSSELLAWTAPGSDDAWLVLDRNGNGTIDNGMELFGDYTPQPQPPTGESKNGFLALAEYDKPQNGGNNDRRITSTDSIFSVLRLWQDLNHNGISEAQELHSLNDFNLKVIDLDYKPSKRTDQFGNHFRYRTQVKDFQGTKLGRWAWDVFLLKDR